jgi:hypothetical protein
MGQERPNDQQGYPYHEEYYDSGKLMYEIFAVGYAAGAIVHPSSRVDYNYQGNLLVGETVTQRDDDGSVVATTEYEWYTEKVGKAETRRKVRV